MWGRQKDSRVSILPTLKVGKMQHNLFEYGKMFMHCGTGESIAAMNSLT